jgi:proteasome assembly chaperone (PAC2) family protein
MGHVALNAGVYLLSRLDMELLAELEAAEFFEVEHIEVRNGLILRGRRPRNRFFLWRDPRREHDLVLFLGEAQPPVGKHRFCNQIISYARQLRVERVITFAAMATQMHPQHRSRTFGAATDEERLAELRRLELEVLVDGQIGGLNGILLASAVEQGLPGACLLGEMPHILTQLPFPKASAAILEAFSTMTGVELDFTALHEQVRAMEERLGELLSQVEAAYGEEFPPAEEEYTPQASEEPQLGPEDEQRIEELFQQAQQDRSKAFALKQELDRLEAFPAYEDRFLDLFKKSG